MKGEIADFLEFLEAVLPDCDVRIGVAWLSESEASVAVSPLDAELEDEAQRILRTVVGRLRRRGDQPLELGGDLSKGSFGRLEFDAARKTGLLHAGLSDAIAHLQDFAAAEPINLAMLERELPSFYVFVVYTPEEDTVLFGRRLNRMNLARRGAIRFIVGDEATLKAFDEELVVFDDQIDWVFVEDEFLVLKPEQVEAALIDPVQLQDRTRANARAIHEKVPISNFADFERRCLEMPGMQARLARIVSSKEWQSWQPNVEALREYSRRYGDVVDWDETGTKMMFDGQTRRQWNILKLLDQAFYTGELTETQYEATGKQSVQA